MSEARVVTPPTDPQDRFPTVLRLESALYAGAQDLLLAAAVLFDRDQDREHVVPHPEWTPIWCRFAASAFAMYELLGVDLADVKMARTLRPWAGAL